MARSESNAQGNAGEQLRDKATQVKDDLRDMGEQVRDAAQEKYEHLRDEAARYYEQGRESAREWEGNVESYVRERPIKSLLIAAGVGAVLGFLWRRS